MKATSVFRFTLKLFVKTSVIIVFLQFVFVQQTTIVAQTPPELEISRWHNTKEPLELRKLKGKLVLLDFWGIWCSGCVANIPKLSKLRETFSKEELEIITIHTPFQSNGIEKFIKKYNYALIVGVDKRDPDDKQTHYGLTTKSFKIKEFPSYVIVDRAGFIVKVFEETLPSEDQIRKVLNK